MVSTARLSLVIFVPLLAGGCELLSRYDPDPTGQAPAGEAVHDDALEGPPAADGRLDAAANGDTGAAADATPDTEGALAGDLDGDGDVDQDDVDILMRDRNKPVADSACGARCDLDGDGTITVLDARLLVLRCTRPLCAVA